MSVTFTVTIDTRNADKGDRGAAQRIVGQENTRRAALDTPGTPLATTPVPALLASYKTVLEEQVLLNAHNSYIQQSTETTNKERRTAFANATTADQDAVDAILGV